MNMYRKILIFPLFILFLLPLRALETVPELVAESAVLYDFATGRVLFEKNGEISIPPASMTKLVTLYLGWQYLENGGSPDEPVEITATGSSFSRPVGSSLMLLEEGQKVSFLEVMTGLAVASGNDAAYALAEHISGSPEAFVDQMNSLVESLGYKTMHFVDPDGWSAENRVTALEYAEFSSDYIRAFPSALQTVHSLRTLVYPKAENLPETGGRIITPREKNNTNILLDRVEGVDGLKTGYIDESGFNFTATAKRGITRFIAVVMGIRNVPYFDGIEIRADEAEALLEYGFRNFKTIDPETPLLEPVFLWEGKSDEVPLILEGDPLFTLSVDEMTSFSREIDVPAELTAPVRAGDIVGKVRYRTGDRVLAEFPVLAQIDVEKANIFKVLWHRTLKLYRRITNP
ncbi:D-alanyl-D-alanine carboxypeptidase family protein [Spirochaeta isovalerica]|uniref:serine-type D-Ala-D-Ala carboxypeptidase n=1 Tax=Spirochaeta isovalerica TaxID=150 RepID=A0A841RDL2_9SPIO|nr:D-alanyl-D-alanine carboxypeptidase family protein [Spirochaeta isovalerica]MBB6481471.1 D-alanyl-D-alanine carboxypeptidase (penicillin-binding protein 5/6) [Spirochaeta isovalerica]